MFQYHGPRNPQRRKFEDDDKPPMCWIHHPDCTAGFMLCVSPNHSCTNPGTGRLGLCPDHESEVIPDGEEEALVGNQDYAV